MPPRRRTSSRRPQSRYAWTHVITDPANVTANGQASVDLLSNSVLAETTGATIIRVVGNLWLLPGDAENSSELTYGLAMVGNDAAVAGAIPDPSTDVSFPWMHWARLIMGEASTLTPGGHALNIHLDIKAKRKVRDSLMELRFILDNDDGTHTFQFALGLRVLLKLP